MAPTYQSPVGAIHNAGKVFTLKQRGKRCKGMTCEEWADAFAKEKPKTAASVAIAEVAVVSYIGYKVAVKALQYI